MKQNDKSLTQKINNFIRLCGDWDYRNIDMTKPHISYITINNNKIKVCCEIYSPELDEYIFSNEVLIEDKKMFSQFKKLNLKKKNDVLEFIKKIESFINWDDISNFLCDKENEIIKKYNEVEKEKELKKTPCSVILDNEKIIFENKKLAINYYKDLSWLSEEDKNGKYRKVYKQLEKNKKEYNDGSDVLIEKCFKEEDYDNMEAVKVPSKLLGEGWYWYKYNDGSGHLESPDGKQYMIYDLSTGEYKENKDSSWTLYYDPYTEDLRKINFFNYAENEMLNIVIPHEKGQELNLL